LKELECDSKEKLVVLNKADLLTTPAQINQARIAVPGAVRLSALDPDAVRSLRERILDHFKTRMETWDLVLPYAEGKLQAQLQEFGSIQTTRYLEKGVFMQVMLDSGIARKLGVRKYATSKNEDQG
jgi:50S ribosomal subunit-associated GTPase HflX